MDPKIGSGLFPLGSPSKLSIRISGSGPGFGSPEFRSGPFGRSPGMTAYLSKVPISGSDRPRWVACLGHRLGGSLCEIFAACANSRRLSGADFRAASEQRRVTLKETIVPDRKSLNYQRSVCSGTPSNRPECALGPFPDPSLFRDDEY